mmetsp:Transcript_3458/g.7882  ORF Transcript_3458/g.7882 Transcript_3458/m.7882 type:complete len:412 (+) Transcript_3458:205-1440(+)
MPIPIELKVLCVLRVLGRGCMFDDIAELSGMSVSSAHRAFTTFIHTFPRALYSSYVYAPEGEHLRHVMAAYDKLGFTGCVGSTDCVHVKMDCCPVSLYWKCTGKEGFPTLAYSVTVDHGKRILASTASYYGSRNDKTISWYDTYLMDLRDDKYPLSFKAQPPGIGMSYKLFKLDGSTVEMHRPYVLCDGGYNHWATMMPPFGATSKPAERRWGEMLESVRKDVECTFGILKSRFRILRHGMRLHKPHSIDGAWFTCCMLHNMLLDYDGIHVLLNTEAAWEAMDPGSCTVAASMDERVRADLESALLVPSPEEASTPAQLQTHIASSTFSLPLGFGGSCAPPITSEYQDASGTGGVLTTFDVEVDSTFASMRESLVHHMQYRYHTKTISWPKTNAVLADLGLPVTGILPVAL